MALSTHATNRAYHVQLKAFFWFQMYHFVWPCDALFCKHSFPLYLFPHMNLVASLHYHRTVFCDGFSACDLSGAPFRLPVFVTW